jgi:uncharacterized membrane protein
MKAKVVNFVAEMFVWTLLAFFVEVIVTATVERWSLGPRYMLHQVPWYSFQGHTTIWDFVDGIGMTAGLRLVVRAFHRYGVFRSWVARGLFTMILIYLLEFVGGLFFNKLLGFQLWDYSQYVWHGVPLHLMGQITLVYAPFWFTAGLFVVPVYSVVHKVAPYAGSTVEKVLADAYQRAAKSSAQPNSASTG